MKSGNSDRLSERKSLTTPEVQLANSFCQNAVSKGHGKFSEDGEKSGKSRGNERVEKSGHPV